MKKQKGPRHPQSQRHHFVPRFYLKKWYSNRDQLVRFRNSDHGFEATWLSAAATGYQDNLYSLFMSDKLVLSLEDDFFSLLDNDAGKALNAFLTGDVGKMTDKHKWDWSLFIASLLYRSPKNLSDSLGEIDEKLSPRFNMSEFVALSKLDAAITWSHSHEGMPPREYERFKAISTAVLHERRYCSHEKLIWKVALLGPGIDRLLLSEHPVVTHRPGLPVEHFSMPLSPDVLLTAAPTKEMIEDFPVPSQEFVRGINRQIILNSEGAVYARDKRPADFVKEFLPSFESAKPTPAPPPGTPSGLR